MKEIGRIGGPADVDERLLGRDCTTVPRGYRAPNVGSSPSYRRADLCTRATRSGDNFGVGKLLTLPKDPPGCIYHPVRIRST